MNQNKKHILNASIDLNLFSRYRNVIFGLAAISIMLFHYSYDVWHFDAIGRIDASSSVIYQAALVYYALIRSVGVEVFLFLSGMGLYYSFSKNHDLKRFYYKRMSRVLIPYLLCGGGFWIVRDLLMRDETWLDVVKDLTFYNFFARGEHYIWFVILIVMLYMIYPPVHYLLNDTDRRNVNFLILMALSIGLPMLYSWLDHDMFVQTNIATMRVPVFILGCYMGQPIREHRRIPVAPLVPFIAATIVLRWATGWHQYSPVSARMTAFIQSVGLLLLLVMAFRAAGKFLTPAVTGRVRRFLEIAGKYSLELYLTHVCLRNFVKQTSVETYEPIVYLLIMAGAFLLSVVLSRATDEILELNKEGIYQWRLRAMRRAAARVRQAA